MIEMIAAVMASNKPSAQDGSIARMIWKEIVNDFAVELRVTNDHFDEDRFKTACNAE